MSSTSMATSSLKMHRPFLSLATARLTVFVTLFAVTPAYRSRSLLWPNLNSWPPGSGTKIAPDMRLVGPWILLWGPNLRPSICSKSRRDSKMVELPITRNTSVYPLPSTSPQPLRLSKRWRPSWPGELEVHLKIQLQSLWESVSSHF